MVFMMLPLSIDFMLPTDERTLLGLRMKLLSKKS
jgi:hypothetical protein